MYKDRGASGSIDRRRINDALDKHLEKSAPSGSREIVGKQKDRISAPSTCSGKHPDHRDQPSASNSKNEEESETDSEESDVSGSDGEDTSWISWFCNLRGNEFFCEVDDDYIQDDFNLCGLSNQVPYYDYALDLMLDVESSHEESETDSEESDVSGSDVEDTSWISWFCNLRGNEFFCEVDDDYIQDDFNLCGLSSQVPYYDYALDLILDVESSHAEFTEEQNELVESAAEMLYGLIHVRYILTGKGMAAMLEKFKNYDFGRCPRVYCCGQPCLPVGQNDAPRSSTVKIYCPKCEDIYYPRSKYQGNLDGAYFGTTFPHLFLMTYGHLKPQKASQRYVPRVFGFKIHKP
ncbi:putative casein kinase II subunit beta-4 isoform X1 [Iris pallida]|uniref:Casein kinase II subunit beta n=1 Tax=Iris pallida TaxID=29817 RepID=A0AAX6DZY7_IRIPA|nr:putative casein kinase II subunit beta-4 isoform X1 [Iris pallida]